MFGFCKPEREEKDCLPVCSQGTTTLANQNERGIMAEVEVGNSAQVAEAALEKSCWRVHLCKAGFDQFGMLLFMNDAALLVTSVTPEGAVDAYNDTCAEDASITSGSFIIGANGVFGKPDALLTAIAQTEELDLVLSNKQPFIVSLGKNTYLGIVVGILANSLLIKEVLQGGAIWCWGEEFPASRVVVGDHLVCVNNVWNDGASLLQALQEAEHLHLIFRKPAQVHSHL